MEYHRLAVNEQKNIGRARSSLIVQSVAILVQVANASLSAFHALMPTASTMVVLFSSIALIHGFLLWESLRKLKKYKTQLLNIKLKIINGTE